MSEPRYKALQVTFKDDEDDAGAVVARFSSFDEPDREGDILRASAFTNGQSVPMVWAHDWSRPIGKGVIKVGKDSARFEGAFFATPTAQEARETVKAMGDLQQWSFGFRITETQDNTAIRGYDITGLELFEVSPVLVGANANTATLAVKGANFCPTCGHALSSTEPDQREENESPPDAVALATDELIRIEQERLALEAVALGED